MARSFLPVLAAAVTVFLSSLSYAASKDLLADNIFFLEGSNQNYLRSTLDGNTQENSFSGEDAAAAIAVLLGLPTPVSLNAASSGKLDSVLSPDPFKRPHGVVSLTIKGVNLGSLSSEELKGIFVPSTFQQRLFSVNPNQRTFELPGQDVIVQVLNNEYEENGPEYFDIMKLEQGLKTLVSCLKGSYAKDEETDVVVLKIPLPFNDGFSISLDLHKRSDWQFASELVSLSQSTNALGLQEFQHGPRSLARLWTGTFTSLELIDVESGRRQDAAKLFLYAAIQMMGALEATHDSQIVGVFVLLSSTSEALVPPMFNVKTSRSSRSLQDELAPSPSSSYSNTTELDVKVQTLIGRSHVVVVLLILIISTLLGSWFLLYMPLTRDTLLYSAVKLD